ncbi:MULTISPECIES: rhomboid family intramembrane serine protease [unclassified Rhizobium]|uniref:rhomboid family intramembrane serine protease n=1 Tax=unclassified Rhizobium TaxID=2613769 RepID=UPI001044365D|nr:MULTISPECIES: rhomboid family intramembrane serine protease [unclassified Rhizobium]MBB3397717.1 membrane associated rhomboid family serine protease [Rhizobium sp. BK060]MBB4170915.1 membrane associated rhomboid family serine protease [Rhizobium sp. BK538]TCM75387.1 membrane associated rhomboid family serine protease [Rhizobium sp. BK068]
MNEHSVEPQAAMEPPAPRSPIFNLPGSVLAALALLGLIYAVQSLFLSGNGLDWLFFNFGFIPLRYITPLSEQGPQLLWTPITYSLLHGSIEHIVFNGLWLMAFGTPVARRIGAFRFVTFWVLSAIAAAALHAALNWGEATLLIGASGVVSGLMGAACRFAFPPEQRIARPAHLNARLSMLEAFHSRTVVAFILFWFVGNLLIAVGVPLIGDGSQAIAWDAHIGGFIFGFILFSLFDRKPPEEPLTSEASDILQS